MADTKQQTGMTRHEPKGAGLAITRQGLEIRSVADARDVAQLAMTLEVGKKFGSVDAMAYAICWASEFGISPFTALQYTYMVRGIPNFWGPIPMAIVHRKAPFDFKRHREYFVGRPGDPGKPPPPDFAAVVEVARIGGQTFRVIYSWADAVRAGHAGKETYKQNPGDMLLNRARLRAIKRAFPEAFGAVGGVAMDGDPNSGGAPIDEDAPKHYDSLSDLPPIDGEVVDSWSDAEPKREAVTAEVEGGKAARLSDPFSDEEIAAALIRFVEIVAKENGDSVAITAAGVLAFERGGVKGNITGPNWFTEHEGKDAAKHATRVDIAREIADRLLEAQDQAFPLCEKAGTP